MIIFKSRYENSYYCRDLFPGQSYQLRVQAKNAIGWSEYSEYSDPIDGMTLVAAPDIPLPPKPMNATTSSLQFELLLPNAYGCVITGINIQIREITAFSISEWIPSMTFQIPSNDIEIVSYTVGHNILTNKSQYTSIHNDNDSNVDNTSEENKIIEKIRYWIKNLKSDTIYETRLLVQNKAGDSPLSLVSLR